MSRQSEYAERANKMRKEELTRKKEKEDKKRDRMCDLHKTTLNMLVMASVTDYVDTPSDTAESCRLFFNCKNAALADQELHQQFEDMGLGDVGFAHGTTQALHNGMFLYSEGSTPSNFTAFSFFEQQPLERDDVCKRALFLILVSTVG